jgi:hypothetical protein
MNIDTPFANIIEQAINTRKSPGNNFWMSIREFFVDFMGSLIPGILFLSFATTIIVFFCILLCGIFTPNIPECTGVFTKALLSFHTEAIIVFVILSFVLGCVFFRMDVKVPDDQSARYIWRKTNPEYYGDCAVGFVDDIFDTQFPYVCLREYLLRRGLDHLANKIPWSGLNKNSLKQRSKMFINILKIRLQYHFPEKCSEIVKHEAHIRLMSSLWHSLKWLSRIAYSSLILMSAILIVFCSFNENCIGNLNRHYWINYLIFTLWIFIIIALVLIVKRSVLQFFHYQRVREIIQVLETAYTAIKDYPAIFEDIENKKDNSSDKKLDENEQLLSEWGSLKNTICRTVNRLKGKWAPKQKTGR